MGDADAGFVAALCRDLAGAESVRGRRDPSGLAAEKSAMRS